MTVFKTERLVVRRLVEADAGFMRELVNEPAWIRGIGDRRVHTLEDARAYIRRLVLDGSRYPGFGYHLVERQADGVPLGICGLLKREALEDADVGYAFLSRHGGQGYAREAAAGMLAYGREVLGLARIVAVTNPDNLRSIRLLEQLGMAVERTIRWPGESEDLLLFAPVSKGPGEPAGGV